MPTLHHPRQLSRTAAGHAARGFTLIEILIVLAIVLLLASLVSVSLFSRRDQADIQITQVNLTTLSKALDSFRLDYRRYPNEEEGLEVLWDRETLDAEADTSMWSKYVTQPMTSDPWGNAYGYSTEEDDFAIDDGFGDEESTGPSFQLWSNGPDGEEGTEDDITVGGQGSGDADSEFEDFLPAGDP